MILKPQINPRTITAPLSPNEYVTKFNNDLQKAKETEYRSKNSRLFTWKQTFYYQSKLKVPPSLKQAESFNNTMVREEPSNTSTPAIPDISRGNSPVSNQMVSPKGLENEINALVQTLSPKKRVNSEKQFDFYSTMDTFKNFNPNAHQIDYFDMGKTAQNGFFVTQREKKSAYSVSRLQTSLLQSRDASVIKEVPNGQFMSNQFDRRNYTVNKIIGQIKAHDEMLDLAEVKEETVKKLKYVVRNVKPHRKMKSGTESMANALARLNTLASPKHKRELELYSPVSKASGEKSPEKMGIERRNSSPKFKMMKFTKEGNELNWTQKVTPDHLVPRDEEVPGYRWIDKTELSQVKKRAKKLNEKRKPNAKGLMMSVDAGLKDLDLSKEQEMTVEQKKESRNSPLLAVFQSRVDLSAGTPTLVERVEEEAKGIGLRAPMTRGGQRVDDDNIFHYRKYFKRNYLEKGVEFDISRDLRSKIKEFGEEIKESVKKLQKKE